LLSLFLKVVAITRKNVCVCFVSYYVHASVCGVLSSDPWIKPKWLWTSYPCFIMLIAIIIIY